MNRLEIGTPIYYKYVPVDNIDHILPEDVPAIIIAAAHNAPYDIKPFDQLNAKGKIEWFYNVKIDIDELLNTGRYIYLDKDKAGHSHPKIINFIRYGFNAMPCVSLSGRINTTEDNGYFVRNKFAYHTDVVRHSYVVSKRVLF